MSLTASRPVGRPKGSKNKGLTRPLSQLSQEQLRAKIDGGRIIKLLNSHIFDGQEISPTQLQVAKIMLDRVLPVLQSQEIKGDVAHYVARLPSVAQSADAWLASVKPLLVSPPLDEDAAKPHKTSNNSVLGDDVLS